MLSKHLNTRVATKKINDTCHVTLSMSKSILVLIKRGNAPKYRLHYLVYFKLKLILTDKAYNFIPGLSEWDGVGDEANPEKSGVRSRFVSRFGGCFLDAGSPKFQLG